MAGNGGHWEKWEVGEKDEGEVGVGIGFLLGFSLWSWGRIYILWNNKTKQNKTNKQTKTKRQAISQSPNLPK